AEKHDLTVGVLIHREGENLIVDRMDVKQPLPDCPTPVQWVEDWMNFVAREFPRVTFVIDEYQLVGLIQRYQYVYDLKRFEFASGRGNHALAIALRRMILQRQVRWAPGCGQIAESDRRDDLETELASLLLK
ncbi:MAG TPA: terminase, partial [Planctomycetaceae bacterium]|nr:terminase [Planctomycetaceae bacterium]